MPEVKEGEDIPTMLVELSDKGDSGFVQDGTEGTPFEVRLTAPSVCWIPTQGWRKKKFDIEGKPLEPPFANERVRWINGEQEISVEKQRKLGIEPTNNGKGDKIVFEKGFFSVAREGAYVGMYDYFKDAFYNENNPDRSEKATKIWKIIEQDKDTELFNEDEMASADALQYIGSLYTKIGDRKYKYNEEKLNGICSLMGVFAETNAGKIQAIIINAKINPKNFMNMVSRWENTTATEIAQAISLNVIKIEGQVAAYVAKDKIIKSFGTKKIKLTEAVSQLADYLRTSEGHEAYMELKAELEAAQEKTLK